MSLNLRGPSPAALSATFAPLAPQGKRAPARPSYKMITTFQSGHGWTNSSGTFNLNDTTDYILGTQSAKGTTAGAGANTYFRKLAGATFDTTGKDIAIWLKVDDPTHLSTIQLVAGSSTFANTYTVTIYDRTYGGDNVQALKPGEWTEIRFSLAADASVGGTPARNTLTDWQIAFKDDATGNPVTVHCNGLALVPDGKTTWPNGVVSITFDDVYTSQYTQARPKLDQYGFGATDYVIVDRIGQADANTLAQLQELEKFHGWEVAGHSYSTAAHSATFPTLAANGTLDAELRNLKAWLLQNGFKGADHLAYPGGGYDSATEAIVRRYFLTGRTTFGMPKQVPNSATLSRLRVLNITNTTAVATINAAVDTAYANGLWLIFVLHDLVTTPTTATQFSIANFGTIIDYLATKGIPVRTVGEVFNSML